MWDFVANATVTDINSVPEQFRGLYVEKDGKFVVSDAAKGLVDAYVGQTTALNKVRKDLKTANDEAASRRVTKTAVLDFAKGLGLENIDEEDPLTSLSAFVQDLVTKGKGGSELKANLDKIKGDSERRIKEVQDAADGKVSKMKGTLEKYLVSQAATAALAKHGGNIDLLLDRVVKSTKVVEEGDDYVVRVVDEAGDFRSDGAGGWMTIDGFVADLKTKPTFAVAFKSETPGGNGHKPNSSNGGGMKPQQGEKTAIDKIAEGIKKGAEKGE